MKKFLITANWKLNGSFNFINKNINLIKKMNRSLNFCHISLAPPYVYLNYINNFIKNTTISLTAQNVDIHLEGSFTGETSINMLKDIGIKYIIVGHSERKIYHNENINLISKKFILIKKHGLIPILCIGETKEEKKHKLIEKICINQIDNIFKLSNDINIFNNTIIAYEPIWAIGSGNIADINEVKNVIFFIRKYISSLNKKIIENIYFLYGGSVDYSNIDNFLNKKYINGFLIGKTSLKLNNFIFLIEKIEKNLNFNRS